MLNPNGTLAPAVLEAQVPGQPDLQCKQRGQTHCLLSGSCPACKVVAREHQTSILEPPSCLPQLIHLRAAHDPHAAPCSRASQVPLFVMSMILM